MPTTDPTSTTAAYEDAVARYDKAVEQMNAGQLETAATTFDGVNQAHGDEPSLGERARVYARVCRQRLTTPPAEPVDPEACYRMGVARANAGQLDDALRLLDRAVASDSSSARNLYARASAWALKGNVDAAIGDLRQAIALDPPTRFQAANDQDFEQIREEPAFIDIIEPTPTGA